MNKKIGCKQVLGRLNAYIDNELPEDMKKIVAGHLVECRLCRREYDSLKQVNSSLMSLKTDPLPHSLRQKITGIPLADKNRPVISKFPGRIAPLPAAAALFFTLIAASLLGRSYLNYSKSTEVIADSYQIAQESFYTLWEEIVHE